MELCTILCVVRFHDGSDYDWTHNSGEPVPLAEAGDRVNQSIKNWQGNDVASFHYTIIPVVTQ